MLCWKIAKISLQKFLLVYTFVVLVLVARKMASVAFSVYFNSISWISFWKTKRLERERIFSRRMKALMKMNKFSMTIRFNYAAFTQQSIEPKHRENYQNICIKFRINVVRWIFDKSTLLKPRTQLPNKQFDRRNLQKKRSKFLENTIPWCLIHFTRKFHFFGPCFLVFHRTFFVFYRLA